MPNLHFDLQQLRAFFTVIKLEGFSNAAKRLNVTQSAISHAVHKLEDTAGIRLFDRIGRRVRPTEEGIKLYHACESIFSILEAVEEGIQCERGQVKGPIRLGVPIEFGTSVLMRHIRPFIVNYPDIEMDFYLSNDLLTPLLREDIDLAIDCIDHNISHLERTPLFQETYVVACSPSYLAMNNIHSPEDLARCNILSLDKEGIWWRRFLVIFSKKNRPTLNRIMTINHIRGMINAAASDLGVILVPSYSLQRELSSGSIIPLFPSIRLLEDYFYLYQKTTKTYLLKHRLLKEYFQSLKLSEFDS